MIAKGMWKREDSFCKTDNENVNPPKSPFVKGGFSPSFDKGGLGWIYIIDLFLSAAERFVKVDAACQVCLFNGDQTNLCIEQ